MNRLNWKLGRFILYIAILFIPQSIYGDERRSPFDFGITEKKNPIVIVSKQLEIHQKEGQAIYRGTVMGKQGDSTLYCEKLTIFFDRDGNTIKRIVAEGKVKIETEGRIAIAGKAEFDSIERTVILTENPSLQEGENIIKGSKITIFLDKGRSLIESDPGQKISTVIYPKRDEKKSNAGKMGK
jgi:lipopolysaccharide export system protein LptA